MNAWKQAAFAAHHAGDRARTRDVLTQAGEAILNDCEALQLRSLAEDEPADARALMELAALAVDPGNPQAVFNLAVTDQAMNALDRAQLGYEQVLRIDPRHLGALNNLSDLLRRQGRGVEAWDCMQRFLAAGGSPEGLEIRLAKIADDIGDVAAARLWFARAIERDGGTLATRWERAMQQLRDEEFADGWANYECRRDKFPHDVLAIVDYSSIAEWDGTPLAGRSLLVHKEQGLGDTMMFASCLTDVAQDASALHLAVAPALVRLFAASFPQASVWASASTGATPGEEHQAWRPVAGAIDAHVPFGTLPFHLRRAGFPAPRRYLSALPEDVAAWSWRLARIAPGADQGVRAGLVLSARRNGMVGPGVADGHTRTIPTPVASTLAVPGVTWFGLQERSNIADFAHVPGLSIVNCSDWLYDMADTAALIEQLDVVVTVDTSVAHLAGALGRKVLLMVRRLGDWRWSRTRTDSYWYPDVEVFRQEHEGDWAPVLRSVAARLAELVQEKPGA